MKQRHLALVTAMVFCGLLLSTIARVAGQEPTPTREQVVEATLTLTERSLLHKEKGELKEALRLAKHALTLAEIVWRDNENNNHENLATVITNLADLYRELGPLDGDIPLAEELYQRALKLYVGLRLQNLEVARTSNNLAGLYRARGDYLAAQPLYEHALKIRQEKLGLEHRLVADSFDNLGLLYGDRGDYARAIKLHERALAIYRKEANAEKDLAISLGNLALASTGIGDLERAETLYREAIKIERKIGILDPGTLNGLGRVLRVKGDLAGAERVLLDALLPFESNPHLITFDLAVTLNNLGIFYTTKGDLALAKPRFVRAIEITTKLRGPEHPDLAAMLNNLAGLDQEEGKMGAALATRTRVNDIRERNLRIVLTTGSEEQKRTYLDTLIGETFETVTLHVDAAPASQEAARLALTTILRRKGRALDAVADELSALRSRADSSDIKVLNNLSAVRAQLASVKFNASPLAPAERQARVRELEAEAERLEGVISLRSAEFRVQSQAVTLDQVQENIPDGAALVEMFSYRPYVKRTKKKQGGWGASRYVAYVLRRQGPMAFVSLGDAAPINDAVRSLREALAYPESANVKKAARALDGLLMQNVRPLLGGAKHLLISPDGALNLLPFAALVDENNRYLAENYLITYLTSGRDLLRLKVPMPTKHDPLIVANPDFGATIKRIPLNPAATIARGLSQPELTQTRATRSGDMLQAKWTALEGTAEEAQIIKGLLPRARVLSERDATEAALKLVAGPRVLHISTHGFFLPDLPTTPPASPLEEPGSLSEQKPREENPLLRSGLVLAGANQRNSGVDEDGILTALEAATLDLRGTKLVVLSACETGVGDVKNGEGVYGLRRALVLAGAASQLMSLWQVDDQATRQLMVDYYENLNAGEGRSEAVQKAQRKMLARPDRSHPYYWASFIPIGDWRSITVDD